MGIPSPRKLRSGPPGRLHAPDIILKHPAQQYTTPTHDRWAYIQNSFSQNRQWTKNIRPTIFHPRSVRHLWTRQMGIRRVAIYTAKAALADFSHRTRDTTRLYRLEVWILRTCIPFWERLLDLFSYFTRPVYFLMVVADVCGGMVPHFWNVNKLSLTRDWCLILNV
jgi:hypothetical protein